MPLERAIIHLALAFLGARESGGVIAPNLLDSIPGPAIVNASMVQPTPQDRETPLSAEHIVSHQLGIGACQRSRVRTKSVRYGSLAWSWITDNRSRARKLAREVVGFRESKSARLRQSSYRTFIPRWEEKPCLPLEMAMIS
jgi:hypothetical protein